MSITVYDRAMPNKLPATVYYNTVTKDYDRYNSSDCDQDITFWLGEEGDTTLPPKSPIPIPSQQDDFYVVSETHMCEYFPASEFHIPFVWYYDDTQISPTRCKENQRRYISFWLGIEAEVIN